MADDNNFLEDGELDLDEINQETSTKTNMVIYSRNFVKIEKYLKRTRDYIAYLASVIDVDNLVERVISKLQSTKVLIQINNELTVDEYEDQEVFGIIYRVTRTGENVISITNQTDESWNVSNIMINVKTVSGMIVYPTIITANNSIEINFNDGLSKLYNTFLI